MRPRSKPIGLFLLCGFLAAVGCGRKESAGERFMREGENNPAAAETDPAGMESTRPYETTADVKLRSGPGPKYKVLTEIKSGTRVNVAGREGEWLKVVSKKGNPPGYINAQDARPLGEPAQVRKPFVPGSYVTTQQTSVRRGPGNHYDSVATVPKDTKVHVVGSEGGWLKVESKHGKEPGYILEKHAMRSQPAEPRHAPGSYVTTEDVSVRRGPGTHFEAVATIPRDTKVNVVDSEGEWLKVESRHGKPPGYIPARSARRG